MGRAGRTLLLATLVGVAVGACGMAAGEPSPAPGGGLSQDADPVPDPAAPPEAEGSAATPGVLTAPVASVPPTSPATAPAPGATGAPAAPTAPAPPAGPAAAVPMFRSAVAPITPELADRMTPSSWREGCPVPLEDLRYVTVSHVTFDGTVATGELVVHADVADGVVGVFAALFAERYPVRSMRLVDDFGGDDTDSMDADNTSAFNCRAITGGTSWSEHAYGRAIDLNPVENPYVLGRHVAPVAGRDFADRPDLPGVIHAGDVVVEAFAAAGWQWGGYWDSPLDYQHFSVSGR